MCGNDESMLHHHHMMLPSKQSGFSRGGGDSFEPPLIDFGDDDMNQPSSCCSAANGNVVVKGLDQQPVVDPFSWGSSSDQHHHHTPYTLVRETHPQTSPPTPDYFFVSSSAAQSLPQQSASFTSHQNSVVSSSSNSRQSRIDTDEHNPFQCTPGGMDLLTGSLDNVALPPPPPWSEASPNPFRAASSSSRDDFLLRSSGYLEAGGLSGKSSALGRRSSNQVTGEPTTQMPDAPWIESTLPPTVVKYAAPPQVLVGENHFLTDAFSKVSVSNGSPAIPMSHPGTATNRSAGMDVERQDAPRGGGRLFHSRSLRSESSLIRNNPETPIVVSSKLTASSTTTFLESNGRPKRPLDTEMLSKPPPTPQQSSPAPPPPRLSVPPGSPFKQSSVVVAESKQARQSCDFLASGGGKGSVYRAPSRGFLQAGHPVPLELRPHPLKDIHQSTKTILCTETSLWAAFDFGLQVWDIESATGCFSEGVDNLVGDEDAAAYCVLSVHASPTLCLALDIANEIVWSGHKDGKVRAWPAQVKRTRWDPTLPSLVWEGHRTPVTAIVVTSYGELWTGSESGSMKAWPCEVTSHGLRSSGAEGEYAVAAFMAKSSLTLRGPTTGMSPALTEVRFLVAEHSNGRIWAGGIHHIALWDARTREIIKVFGASVFSEPNLSIQEFSPGHEVLTEERAMKKEKSLGRWLHRSRNAFMGAADAVRRATDRSVQVLEDARRLQALVASPDGTVWGGLGNGLLVQWDAGGNRVDEFLIAPVAVKCLLVLGSCLWVGYTNGKIQVLQIGNRVLVGSWGAHHSPLVQMVRGKNYVFTLASNGGIRGWHIASLSPEFDSLLQMELSARAGSFTQQQHFRLFAGTWNVSQEKPSLQSLRMWLAEPSADASMVFVGIQEMETGAGAIGIAAVKETVGGGLQEKGSANGQWWLDNIGAVIGEGKDFERLASRQLAGLLLGVWVRKKFRTHIGDVDAAAVACGFGRTLGNKGAVGLKMTVFRRTVCVVNSHFAAHQEKVASRNADFEYIYNQMSLGNKPVQYVQRGNGRKNTSNSEFQDTTTFMEGDPPSLYTQSEVMGEAMMPDLSQADILIWFGDLNYRIDVSYDEAMDLIRQKRYDLLLLKDQLRNEMKSGRTFQGMREGFIKFAPTYKFDRGSQVYDTSEKRRVPAYCDRVIFRDSIDGNDAAAAAEPIKLCRPAKVTVAGYEACMDITDSDHKPVRCVLSVDLAVINQAARRREFGDILHNHPVMQAYLEKCNIIPRTSVSTKKATLDESSSFVLLRVTNESSKLPATFTVHCEGEPRGGECPCGDHYTTNFNTTTSKGQTFRGGYGFPQWLQVQPAAGMIGRNSSIEISIHYVGPGSSMSASSQVSRGQPNWWRDDKKAKVVVMVVTVSGLLNTKSEQHRLCVCKGTTTAASSLQQASQEQQQWERESSIFRTRSNPPANTPGTQKSASRSSHQTKGHHQRQRSLDRGDHNNIEPFRSDSFQPADSPLWQQPQQKGHHQKRPHHHPHRKSVEQDDIPLTFSNGPS